jgi:molecular chaperone HtpG
MGEIHVLDRRIRPNGRRDNFELNHHAYNLITQIGPVAAQIAKRCRAASVARNSSVIIRNTISHVEDRLSAEQALAGAEVSRHRAAIQRCTTKLKGVPASDSRELEVELASLDRRLAALSQTEQGSVVALDEALALIAKHVTNREQARRLSAAIREIGG